MLKWLEQKYCGGLCCTQHSTFDFLKRRPSLLLLASQGLFLGIKILLKCYFTALQFSFLPRISTCNASNLYDHDGSFVLDSQSTENQFSSLKLCSNEQLGL
jgi:hypothetical protein